MGKTTMNRPTMKETTMEVSTMERTTTGTIITGTSKEDVMEKLAKAENKAKQFLYQDHTCMSIKDPERLETAINNAENVLEAVAIIKDVIGDIFEHMVFESLNIGEFEKYLAISNSLGREEVKAMPKEWRELYGNIAYMDVLVDEKECKVGVIYGYEIPPICVMYFPKI